MRVTRRILSLVLVVLCVSVFAMTQDAAKPKPTPKPKREQISAVAVLPRASARTASWVDIRFNGYSSDAETQELANVLLNSGGDALRKELEKRKAIGSISLSRRVGFFDFKLIRSRPIEGGRRIIAVSDRPIGFLEAYYAGRSLDHNVGILVLELRKDKNGKEIGEGTLIYAADISIKDGHTVEIENLGIDPIRLTNAKQN